jgi:hypothetical protein
MGIGKIYSVFDEGEYIGSYTPDVAEMVIGIPQYRVQAYAKDNLLYHKRYSFELEDSGSLTVKEKNKKLENDLKLTARFLLLADKAGWTRGNR